MPDFERFLQSLAHIGLDPSALPEYRRALAIKRVLVGESADIVSREVGMSRRWLAEKSDAVATRGLAGLIPGLEAATDPEMLHDRRLGIAQMLLGTLAEQRFELLSQEITGGRRLYIEDHVRTRTDTDYLLRNGSGNPVCRMNIKFHGSLFRQARDLVGLDPDDCFALATYKIFNALRRQDQEALPYVFLVLTIRDLTAASVAANVPEDLVWLLSVLGGRRIVEEAIARELGRPEYREQFQGILARMTEGEFRLISARRAFTLLGDRLFERVFALRVRRFNQSYRNAEIDMHLSISQELTPLRGFLEILARDSLHVLNVRLDRGEI